MRFLARHAVVVVVGASLACVAGEASRPEARSVGATPAPHAEVELAVTADRAFTIRDTASGASASVALREAIAAPAQSIGDRVVYRGALRGGDVTQRLTTDGVEDFVALDGASDEPSVAYVVTLGDAVAGLRLVAQNLELLDARGAPRLRMRAPYLVGADGARVAAQTSVEGCAVDASPVAPWGRATTPPGARACVVHVSWPGEAVRYPALLDPSWSTTGTLSIARSSPTSSMLPDGRVIVVGGAVAVPTTGGACGGPSTLTAEVFDVPSNTWSTTGSLHHFQFAEMSALLTDGDVLVADSESTYSETYDPSTGLFTAAANTPASNHKYGALVAVPSGGALFIAGYTSGGQESSAVDFFDGTTGTWGARSPTATTRVLFAAAAAASNDTIVIAGGYETSTTHSLTVEIYDPTHDKWTTSPTAAPSSDFMGAAADPNGDFIVFVNTTASSRYEVANDTWTTPQASPTPGWGSVLAPMQQGVLCVRGDSSIASLYDFALDTWTATGAPILTPKASVFGLAPALGGSVVLSGGLVQEPAGCASTTASQIFGAPNLDGGAGDGGAAVDAGVDASAGVDAGAGVDASVGVDAGVDATAGAGVDASVDVDAGADASAGVDASVNADASAGVDAGADATAEAEAGLSNDGGVGGNGLDASAGDSSTDDDASLVVDASDDDGGSSGPLDSAAPPIGIAPAGPDSDAASDGSPGASSGDTNESSGCGCRVARPRSDDRAWLALGLVFVAVSARRKGSLSRRSSSPAARPRRTSRR
jgi:hypothetical protein